MTVSALSPAAKAAPDTRAAPRQSGWARAMAAIRLRHWLHFLLLPLAGRDPSLPFATSAVAIGRGTVIAFCLLAYGYLLNSQADQHMDLVPDKRGVLKVEPGAVRAALIGLVAVALGLSLTAPWIVGVATLVCLASGTAYSVGPRLKMLPLVGSALNIGNFAPVLFVGLSRNEIPGALVVLTVSFAFLLLQNQLLHEAADAEEDARGGVQSTFRRLGRKTTSGLALLSGSVVALVATSSSLAAFAAIAFALATPLSLVRWGDRGELAARLRLAHRGVALGYGAWLYLAG